LTSASIYAHVGSILYDFPRLIESVRQEEFRHRVDVVSELGEGGILALGGAEVGRTNRHR
jgi:hypothetical protein